MKCLVHGTHEGDACPVCEALVAVKAAKALLEEGPALVDADHVLRLHGKAIAALERVVPIRRDSRDSRWK